MPPDVYSVTLAAGAGRRMPADMPPKPCCKVGPVSIIENALRTYEQAGIFHHVVVVGSRAAAVMAEVSAKRQNVLFAFQRSARGTGDAVRCALELLDAVSAPEHVVISAGDKVVEPRVMRGLMEAYRASSADLCLVAGPSRCYPGSGRIITSGDRAQAIVEVPDIKARQLAAAFRSLPAGERPATVGDLTEFASQYLRSAVKLGVYFPGLREQLRGPADQAIRWDVIVAAAEAMPNSFELAGGPVTTAEADAAELCNLSLYAGRFAPLIETVRKLGTDNVQGECYFTDAVEALARQGRAVELFRIDDPHDVMAFNTMEELEEVRQVHAERTMKRTRYTELARWLNYFDRRGDGGLHAEAVRKLAGEIDTSRPCIIVCSPGRANLMGRHVDHQGGACNLMAIDSEIVIAASPRDDDRVNLWNTDGTAYPFRSFAFSELTVDIDWNDWLRTLDSQYVQRIVSGSGGDWINYVMGAALRLQHRYPDRRLRGMDAVVCGDIPIGAGLSSSSALVVAVSEALAELNALNVRPREFVDLCGEAEWFVGTRGGSADHAAIKFGSVSEVVSVSFFPFEVIGRHPFPSGCSLVVCHSGITAKKTENARDRFNVKVACYHMAREVIRREFPDFAPLIEHLRDVNTQRLDVPLPTLYRMLRRLPERIEAREVEQLAAAHPRVAKCVSALDLEQYEFPLRSVALYGLAECERAARTGRLLDSGDVTTLGHMMNISHDGDRVARWRPEREDFSACVTDEHIDALIDSSLRPESLSASEAALWQQPGAYACSTPEIDLMVDRALECPGVLGAQLAGAGLGGCIMVLVRSENADQVQAALVREYYEPQGVEPRIFVCRASHGSRVFTTVEAEW